MSREQRVLDAYFEGVRRSFNDMMNDSYWQLVESGAFQNIDTGRKIILFQKLPTRVNGKVKNYRFVWDEEKSRPVWEGSDFNAAMIETCLFGNAAAQPFIAKLKDTWAVFSHKGVLRNGKFHRTLGEAKQSLKKLEPVTPKLSSDEVEERTRDWLRRMIKQGMSEAVEQEKREKREREAEVRRARELEEQIGQGYGAW